MARLRTDEFTNPGLWSLLFLAIVTGVVLHLTVFGRHVYAVGSNEATARLCGVNVARTQLIVYTLAGLLTGWAGVILFAHSNSGNPTLGEQMELDVITAVVIGGASLSGGKGTVIGALLGVAILGLIKNGVSLFNVPVEMQYILIGVLLLANVALNRWRRGRCGRRLRAIPPRSASGTSSLSHSCQIRGWALILVDTFVSSGTVILTCPSPGSLKPLRPPLAAAPGSQPPPQSAERHCPMSNPDATPQAATTDSAPAVGAGVGFPNDRRKRNIPVATDRRRARMRRRSGRTANAGG